MSIASLDDLLLAMKVRESYDISKFNVATTIAGQYASLWTAQARPTAGAVPVAAAVCSDALLGAIPLIVRTGGQERVLTNMWSSLANLGSMLILEDRLAHMGGLNGTVLTAQTVNVDASVATSNLVARVGDAGYNQVSWWAEWYTATGIGTPTISFAVTFADGTTGTANAYNSNSTTMPASIAAGRRYPILSTNGKMIKSIQTATVSVTMVTAGNFGVTATRRLASLTAEVALKPIMGDWATMGAPIVADNSCLTFSMNTAGTSTGQVFGALNQGVH